MYEISELFKDYLHDLRARYIVKVDIDGVGYDDKNIIDFEIENSIGFDEFVLGAAVQSKLTLRVRLKSIIPPNAKVVPYLALTKDDVGSEWLPLGEFYVDNRERNGDVWTFTCYDKLVWGDVPYISALTYPASQQAVWDEICDSLGYEYDDSVVIDPSYMFGAGAAGFSKRQVLGFIAGCNGSNLIVRKNGVIGFQTYSASNEPAWSFDRSDYMSVRQINPRKTYTRIVGIYDTTDELFYEAGQGDENHTLYIENPFITQQIVNDLYAKLNGFSYLPISLDALGAPHLDQGDVIEVGMNESGVGANVPWEDAYVAWEDAHFPWDGVSYHRSIILHHVMTFKGGLSSKIEAPSISEQQSEFKVANTLAQQIALIAEKYSEDSVKVDRDYFGVSISDTKGFISQTFDGRAEMNINALGLRYEIDGVDVLYYDSEEGRLVLKDGIIEASTFIGSEFYGGLIEGTEIRTSATGTRIVFSADDNLLEAVSSEPNRIMINANYQGLAAFILDSANYQTGLQQVGDLFTLESDGRVKLDIVDSINVDAGTDINFEALNMDFEGSNAQLTLSTQATLRGDGGIKLQSGVGSVEVDSWSKVLNVSNSQNLQTALNNKVNTSLLGGSQSFEVNTPSGVRTIHFTLGFFQNIT